MNFVEICPQCNKPIEPRLMGKDSRIGALWIKCPLCGWKTHQWHTEAAAWAEWEKMKNKSLDITDDRK